MKPIKFSKRVAGARAKQNGDTWEIMLSRAARMEDTELIKIPDGCRTGGRLPSGKPILIRVKTPFDFMAARHKEAAYFDAKTIANKSFPHSLIDQDQVANLARMYRKGFPAGYVVNLREPDHVVFFSVPALISCESGTSLTVDDGISLGSWQNFSLKPIFTHHVTPIPTFISPV